MKKGRVSLHIALLLSFALPWLKIPFFVTVVPVVGYLLPFKTSELAQQLSSLGVTSISFEQMFSLYLMLLAPILSVFVLASFFSKHHANIYLDCAAGVISVMCCLYILTNTGNIVTYGLYVAMIVSLLLVASPLWNAEREKVIKVHNRAVMK